MKWIKIDKDSPDPPFTKVAVYDGGNIFWGWLQKIEITNNGKQYHWHVDTPKDYPDYVVYYWMKVPFPDETTIAVEPYDNER